MVLIRRRPEEIAEKINKSKNDLFGDFCTTLICALPEDFAKQHCPDLANAMDPSAWNEHKVRSEDDVVREILEYFPFAVDKYKDRRVLSCVRNVDRFRAWFWLLLDESIEDQLEDSGPYGVNILQVVANKYNLDF